MSADLVAENAPTRAYLAARTGGAHPPLDPELPGYRRFRSWFTRPLLSRPAILDADQARRLDHDLPLLLRTLQALPDRLFGGDQESFARALGWTQPSARVALRKLSGPPVPLGRADLVRGPDGFRLVEFNTSSSLGSMEFGELCRAVLGDPGFTGFAAAHALDFHDPMPLMAATLLETAGWRAAKRPTIALVDWVTSPVTVNASLFIDLLAELGFPIVVCTVKDLEFGAGGLTARGERIDIVYRTFLFKTVAEDPAADELLEPLAQAVAHGAARVFSPLNADLFGSKLCLAMLSDTDAHATDPLTPTEREVVDRVLPWTRSMRGADATPAPAPGGGSLAEYVRAHRGELVLKPSIGHAGQGVVAGWLTEQDAWDALVRAACAGDHVVQRRAESVAERFHAPGAAGPATATCHLHWGLFVTAAGLSGGFVKGLLDREQDIRFLGDGSHVGCVFHSAVRPTRQQ
ncbi:hypothetical protein [Streptomyces sp. PT12]|uniref:hypothetical protein n=1 Tax=Streptomyces sp. PT12 TaxID=1510197 RepID=UPI000DE57B1A|nr:hypothetical protein [Streptomyces sp. PT12]RBM19445.1 hypothetical protein DEH69_10755 [Streptomyces sp. PT12]